MNLTRRTALASTLALAACGQRAAPANELRVGISGLPDSLDPARGQFASAALIYKQIHAGLTEYGADGQLAPGLAEHWQVAPDGLAWTFTLREDLHWSDGHPLTAADIAWSALRLVDPEQSFAVLGDFQNVVNARAIVAGELPAGRLGVDILDDRRVRFRLDQPLGLFPLLMREFYPFPRHVIARVGDDWIEPEHWVSAGAYTVAQVSQGDMTLHRNPYFYGFDDVAIARIHIQAVREDATRVRLFRAGDLDLADNPPSHQIDFLRDQLGSRFRSFDAPVLRYLKLNHDRPELADPVLRGALDHAIDRAFLVRELFAGTAAVARQVLPAPASDDGMPLISQFGSPTPDRPLQIRTTTGLGERIAVSLADDWRKIGVTTESFATYPTDLYQAVDAGDFDIAIASFNRGLKSDPFFMLDPFAPDGFAANFNWRDAAFAALMEAARRESDPERRAGLYREANDRIAEQHALVPLVHERAHWLVSDRLAGVRADVQPQLWRNLSISA